MNEDYLWDRSGEPDSEIAHLEEALSELRWRKPALGFPHTRTRRRWPLLSIAAAAALLFAAGATVFVRAKRVAGPVTSWQLSLAGTPGKAVRGGQLIETGDAVRGTMHSEFVGEVNLEPHSRLRLIASREGLQQLALERGTIHAFIWAPPATFVVDTPSAKTVDLGCRYTLTVANDGSGFLSVEMGWVAFESRGVESFIPAGAVCSTSRGHGPGTPYFKDAPQALSKRVAEFDQNGGEENLQAALVAARRRDALTLWHLLRRTGGRERAEVFDRFAALVSLPAIVTRDAILRGDQSATDAAWNALELGDMTWWRGWKRRW
jgi:hypothetical protein